MQLAPTGASTSWLGSPAFWFSVTSPSMPSGPIPTPQTAVIVCQPRAAPSFLKRRHGDELPQMAAARERSARSWLWLSLMLLWAGLNASFVLGLALSAAINLTAVWEGAPQRRIATLRKMAQHGHHRLHSSAPLSSRVLLSRPAVVLAMLPGTGNIENIGNRGNFSGTSHEHGRTSTVSGRPSRCLRPVTSGFSLALSPTIWSLASVSAGFAIVVAPAILIAPLGTIKGLEPSLTWSRHPRSRH